MRNLFTSVSFAILTLFAVTDCQRPADVKPKPIADFTYINSSFTPTEQVYKFTNTSKNADRYQWVTSGGVAQTDKDLYLTVTQNGRILVSLTAKSDVGEDTKTENIDIAGIATTGDFLFYTNVPDKGNVSVYINTVFQGQITKYYASGSPSCGEQGFVTVTLPPGDYPYTAKSQGVFPFTWSGTITVVRGACRSLRLTK